MLIDDEEQAKRQRNVQKIKEKDDDAYLSKVLGTYSGRAVLHEILDKCGVDKQISTEGAVRRLGQRDIGIWLKERLLTLDYDSVILMDKEYRARQQNSQL